MAPLHGAFALAKRNDAAVGVRENLNFDVPRPFQIFFEIYAGIAEGVHRFGRRVAERRAANSASLWMTKRMPLPPPPATAFNSTG